MRLQGLPRRALRKLGRALPTWTSNRRVDICGAMPSDDAGVVRTWGDWFFATALKTELEELGYAVNVLPRNRWYERSHARFVIVLRGLCEYVPRRMPGRRFLMWGISHPDDVAPEEYDRYDHVFFASRRLHERLSGRIAPSSSLLLQCADARTMRLRANEGHPHELLFVGNSRGVERRIVTDALLTGRKLDIYGSGWDGTPAKGCVVAPFLERELVGQAYRDAAIVLNDHWDDMARWGIVSNRIFDVLAAGGFVISDDMPEIGSLFGDAVVTYSGAEDLREKVNRLLADPEERGRRARAGQELVLANHTFAQRARQIDEVLRAMG